MTAASAPESAADRYTDRRSGRVVDERIVAAGQPPVSAIYAPETSAVSTGPAEAALRPEGSGATLAEVRSTPRVRTGNRQLLRLRTTLSDRDLRILSSLAEHPFLTTGQIERLHFADHASDATGGRVCRRVLARLADIRAIEHLDRRIGGLRAGSASFVWRLGPVGERLLAESEAADRPRKRRKQPSLRHLEHSLAVAETHIRLLGAARRHVFDVLRVQTEPDSWRPFVGPAGERAVLKPDLYAVTASGEFEDHWFIEVDRGTESLPTLLHKCGQYEAYRRAGDEQRDLGVFPWVLWLMATAGDAARLSQAVTASPPLDDSLFRIAPAERLLTVVQGAPS